MAREKKSIVEAVRELEGSTEAQEMRDRLAELAKRLAEARGAGSEMTEILDDLARTRRVLGENSGLNALYGLQAKLLVQEAEFRRTGRKVIID
ncbi:Uncharacterised protein [Candidatus Burarchaeum australiense]|nr:Uncharacterised protein [Candidatus Burarchaeum australiense]